MSYQLPKKITELSPYKPLDGNFRIRLDANESPFAPSGEAVLELAQSLATSELNRYPDPFAAECCGMFARRFGVSPREVVAGNGSDELISIIINCFMDRGGRLGVFDFEFSMYEFYAGLAELDVSVLRKNQNLKIDVSQTICEINERGIEMLVFSNPCNPTSIVLDKASVERLVSSVGALVVVDEAYMDFSPEESVVSLINKYDNLLVLKTCSKAVGLAGARIGFAIGHERLIDIIKSVKSPYNVNTLTQLAAAAVLRDGNYLDERAAELVKSARELYDGVVAISRRVPEKIELLPPTGANFVYIKTPLAAQIHKKLALSGISVRLLPGALRISAGTKEQNWELLEQLGIILC